MQVAASKVSVAYPSLANSNYRENFQKLIGAPLEACNPFEKNTLPLEGYNVFIEAIQTAYSDHYPFILNPDHIWILISQGIANHISENSETLRSKFVSHEGKLQLDVQDDTFVKGDPNNPWESVFGRFSEEIQKHIGNDNHKLFVADFSTTGPIERAVSEVVLMDAMKNYFSYMFHTCCGIPYVDIQGTVEDWENILDRVKKLDAWDLNWWTQHLIPCLENIINTLKGQNDPKFWAEIFKVEGGSGGPYISGWITNLFPYVIGYNRKTYNKELQRNKIWWSQDDTRVRIMYGLGTESFPPSVSKVDFKWNYYGTIYPYHFLGGFTGIDMNDDSKIITPILGWGVKEVVESVQGSAPNQEWNF